MKGLAADGGLFLPQEIPIVNDWVCFLDCRPSLEDLRGQRIVGGNGSTFFKPKTD
jgi:hypothetical protein